MSTMPLQFLLLTLAGWMTRDIDLASRRVEIAGIVHQPHEPWMRQAARNLTDAVDGLLLKHRYIIMDRDPLFTRGFRKLLASSGVKSVRLPARSPNLNAYAERFVGTVRGCITPILAWHTTPACRISLMASAQPVFT